MSKTAAVNQLDNDLRSLVRSLSPTEKAYFKKLSKRHANEKLALHMQLFNCIDSSDDNCTEAELLKKLKITNPSHFANLKNHLMHELLDTLAFLKRNEEVKHKLSTQIAQIEILLQRRLLSGAIKQIHKAKKFAINHSCLDKLWLILKQEYQWVLQTDHKEKREMLDAIEQEFADLEQDLYWITQLENCLRQAAMLKSLTYLRTTEHDLSEPRKLLNVVLSVPQEKHTDPLLRILYHSAVTISAYLCSDTDQCLHSCNELLKLWKANPHLIDIHPELFLEGISNIIYAQFLSFLPLTVANTFYEIEDLVKGHIKGKTHLAKWEVIRFNTRLKVYHKTFNYEQVANIMDKDAPNVKHLCLDVLPTNEGIAVLSSICISYFVLEEYKKADELLIDIIALNRIAKREDVFYFSQVFQLVILTELKDWYRLRIAAVGAYHQLYKKDKSRPFEKELMLFIKKLPEIIQSNQTKEHINGFLKVLDAYRNDPLKKLHMLYFNFYGWLESKALGLSYKEYMLQKASQPIS